MKNLGLGILNTLGSLFKDKIRDPDGSFVKNKLKDGVSVSTKRVLNLTGTCAIIGTALADMVANGINKMNLILLGVGVVYAIGMSVAQALSNR